MPNDLRQAVANFVGTLADHPDQEMAIRALLTAVIVSLDGNKPQGILLFLATVAHRLGSSMIKQQQQSQEDGFDLSGWNSGNQEPN